MDWLPNIDGVKWFTAEILPLIRARRPACTVAIVGRKPGSDIVSLSGGGIQVTGTVPDVRPHLWGASVSIVPLRIGGGTRLNIYESMAAGTPVVSTTVGAEGLDVSSPENILLADTPQTFADACASPGGCAAAAAISEQPTNSCQHVSPGTPWQTASQMLSNWRRTERKMWPLLSSCSRALLLFTFYSDTRPARLSGPAV